MITSVIIPVWNGEEVLAECLRALLAHSDSNQTQIICVDNASIDGSAALLHQSFPTVKVISQPVNLGFAGGVNAGMEAAQGDIFVLLNQDCIVAPGWLDGLLATFAANEACGIAGAIIEDAHGSLNHAGATITMPLAYAQHLTQAPENDSQVDYVTGALFAIRRSVWQQLGGLDDEFYPAYYEESDYCFRARRQGIETHLAVRARARHLFSSREWQRDPLRHTANQHQSRYRFVCKQFSDVALVEFINAEIKAASAEDSFHESVGRVLASSSTHRRLDEILKRRIADGAEELRPALQRLLAVGFADIYQKALQRSEQLALPQSNDAEKLTDFAEWQTQLAAVHDQIRQLRARVAGQWQLLDDFYKKAISGQEEVQEQTSLQGALQKAYAVAAGRQFVRLDHFQETAIAQHALQVQQLANYEELIQTIDHRINLLETQVTIQEYRRRLADSLLLYAHH
jgi:GT2 family glycosyltransferase